MVRIRIPRKRMKELMARSDGPAIRDTALWLGLTVLVGGARHLLLGHLVGVPFFLVYGVLYGFASDTAGTNAATARPSRRAG